MAVVRYVVGALLLVSALLVQVLMTKLAGIDIDSRWWQGKVWMDMSWARLSDELWGKARKHKLVARSLSDTNRQEVQPDQVEGARTSTTSASAADKCGLQVGPRSEYITRGVNLTAISTYRGQQHGQHTWRYDVTFTNMRRDTIQMLTRHWVFVDSEGSVEEVKGPGARGHTPILAPGESWVYTSGTRLPTPEGSMRGDFQMEVLDGAHEGLFFKASVARVGLLADGVPSETTAAPCGVTAAEADQIPTTSVASTQRVIAGVTTAFVPQVSDPDAGHFVFKYDIQVNNARHFPCRIKSIEWRVVTAEGRMRHRVDRGRGGFGKPDPPRGYEIAPGAATRWMGALVVDSPPRTLGGQGAPALVSGKITVIVEPEVNEIEVVIDDVAATMDGRPITRTSSPLFQSWTREKSEVMRQFEG